MGGPQRRKKPRGHKATGGAPQTRYPTILRHLATSYFDEKLANVRRMAKEGHSLKEIAEAVGYKSETGIRLYMKRNSIAYHKRMGNPGPRPPMDEEVIEKRRAAIKAAGPNLQNRWSKPTNHKLLEKREKEKMMTSKGITMSQKIRGVKAEPYHAEVLKMLDEGVPAKEVAEHFNRHVSRIYQIARHHRGNNWRHWKEVILKAVAETPQAPYQVIAKRLGMSEKTVAEFMREGMRDKTKELAMNMDRREFTVERGVLHPATKQLATAMTIYCGSDGCNNKEHWFTNRFNNHQAAKKFKDMGWAIGAAPRSDRCPACLAKLQDGKTNGAAKKPENRKAVEVALVSHTPKAQPEPLKPAPPAEDRELTRTDRRIIISKLDDVYGENSYTDDWSDEKVAQDLGVPRDWVSGVRDENFGPDISEAAAAQRIDQLEKLASTITEAQEEISQQVKIIHKAAEFLEEKIEANKNRYDEFKRLHETFQH